jgi:hypothetical protein
MAVCALASPPLVRIQPAHYLESLHGEQRLSCDGYRPVVTSSNRAADKQGLFTFLWYSSYFASLHGCSAKMLETPRISHVLACSLSAAAVRPCLEAPLLKRLDRRELVSLALVADASAERAEKVSQQQHCGCWSNASMPGGGPQQRPHQCALLAGLCNSSSCCLQSSNKSKAAAIFTVGPCKQLMLPGLVCAGEGSCVQPAEGSCADRGHVPHAQTGAEDIGKFRGVLQ